MSAKPSKIIVDGDQSLFSYQNGSFAIQDKKLCQLIFHLHRKFQAQFIIVTLQPNIRLIEYYLKKILLEVSFEVIYLPALNDAPEQKTNIAQFETHPIGPPPPGYSFLFDHTKPPLEGWENHVANLEKRLLKTGDFYLESTPESAEVKRLAEKVELLRIKSGIKAYSKRPRSSPNFFDKLKEEESDISRSNSSPLKPKNLHPPPVERSPPRII